MTRENPTRFSDILSGDALDELARRFDEAEAAPEFEPVPAGTYEVDLVHGELRRSQNGTVGYTCHFEIAEGEYRGRKIWHTAWLSDAAMNYSKRDLAKLGITQLGQCSDPVPPGIYCTINVVRRTDDDGRQWNEVKKITAGGVRADATVDRDFIDTVAGKAEGGSR